MDKKCIDIRRFIFTGTPSSGKSSVIKELEKLGHAVIHEAATYVINIEQVKGIERPWEEPGFIDKIILMQKERQMNVKSHCEVSYHFPFLTG